MAELGSNLLRPRESSKFQDLDSFTLCSLCLHVPWTVMKIPRLVIWIQYNPTPAFCGPSINESPKSSHVVYSSPSHPFLYWDDFTQVVGATLLPLPSMASSPAHEITEIAAWAQLSSLDLWWTLEPTRLFLWLLSPNIASAYFEKPNHRDIFPTENLQRSQLLSAAPTDFQGGKEENLVFPRKWRNLGNPRPTWWKEPTDVVLLQIRTKDTNHPLPQKQVHFFTREKYKLLITTYITAFSS